MDISKENDDFKMGYDVGVKEGERLGLWEAQRIITEILADKEEK